MGDKEYKISAENTAEEKSGSGESAPELMHSGLKQLAAMNNVFVSFLETTPSSNSDETMGSKRQYIAVFLQADALAPGEKGTEILRDHLRKAASVPKDKVYCPCRICCITASDHDELLKKYAEASRAIRETAALREIFASQGYPIPQYLSAKTVSALCHFREKLSDSTLPQETRKQYGQCLQRLVQEAHGRHEGGK